MELGGQGLGKRVAGCGEVSEGLAELGELLPDLETRTSLGSELAVAVAHGERRFMVYGLWFRVKGLWFRG